MGGGGGPDSGGEEAGEAPRAALGPVPSPGGRRAGRGLPRRSFPGAALPPLPRPPHRPACPARLFTARSLQQKGCCEGSSPAAPPAAPYRQQIATANKAEIPGAGSPAGIKAPSEACSNRTDSDVRCPRLRRHLRPSPCPLAWLLLGFVCAGQSKGREEEKSFPGPVGAAGFGGAGSWGRLPFVVSFIHKC